MTDATPADPFADPASVAAALTATGYLPDDGIATAVFLAHRLHRPLLLEGDAGSARPRSRLRWRRCPEPN